MSNKTILKNIEKAVVKVLGQEGQGVLVSNNLILTAAHCVNYTTEGAIMALGDLFIEEISTVNGKQLKTTVLAVEPVSDICVLGRLDGEEFPDEVEEFEKFCEETTPVSLFNGNLEPFQKYSVHIYSHKGYWIDATATMASKGAHSIFIEAEQKIERGTSGGPIVNDNGELVAVTSVSGNAADRSGSIGPQPFIQQALPVWALQKINS